MQTDDLTALESWIGDLLSRLSDQELKKINRTVANALRRSQAQRIAAQENPDGTHYTPRSQKNLRGKKGKIKRRAMFARLKTNKHLVNQSTSSEIVIGFRARSAMIALVHQYGQNSQIHGHTFKMPERKLLGLTEHEKEQIQRAFLELLAGDS